jgi:hypothetical protein
MRVVVTTHIHETPNINDSNDLTKELKARIREVAIMIVDTNTRSNVSVSCQNGNLKVRTKVSHFFVQFPRWTEAY